MAERAAVLLSCHGSVEDLDDLPGFLTNIGRGRAPRPEVLDEVRRRYAAIGGSPLMRITGLQAEALAARLGMPVAVAGRLWHPYPAEVLARLHAEGVRTVVSLPLAPQSVHVYHAPVRDAAAALEGMRVLCPPSWGLEPALVDACIEVIEEALGTLGEGAVVVLTAHSLPKRVVDAGDPYERDFRAMAARVAERLAERGVESAVAFQSQGMTGDAWLGPDLPSTFARLAARGVRRAVIAPIGFVSDHVETLYDLDVEAPGLAERAGLERIARAPALNARPRFVDAMEAVVRRALAEVPAPT